MVAEENELPIRQRRRDLRGSFSFLSGIASTNEQTSCHSHGIQIAAAAIKTSTLGEKANCDVEVPEPAVLYFH